MNPIQQERALMLDIGRKYYSKPWLIKLIDYMHELHLNTLQLHFSDNEGFRIASERYPDITSYEHLTKEEIKAVIEHARVRGIEIIPDFDTPGHLQRILTFFPQYQLDHLEAGKLGKDPRSLNIADPEARAFIKSIIAEFAELFQASQYFHIGADEFINFDQVENYPQLVAYGKKYYGSEATGIETYLDYTNEMIAYVLELGFVPRVWNDGFYRKNQFPLVELDQRAQVTYWTRWHPNMADVKTFIDRGHSLINFNDNYFYYVLGENASYTYPCPDKIKNQWHIEKFANEQILTKKQMEAVLGTTFSIWSDLPHTQTEAEVFAGIKAPLKEMAHKLIAD